MTYEKTYNKLLGALIGLARSIDWYSPIEETTMTILIKVLSEIAQGEDLLNDTAIRSLTKELHLEKFRLVPDCFTCLNRCGRTDDYDMELMWNATEEVHLAKSALLDKILEMSKTGSSGETQDRYYVKALISLGEAYEAEMLQSILAESVEFLSK